ncbi:MAG: hypothetical protein JXR07_14510 [Reichenbachiella sp.]
MKAKYKLIAVILLGITISCDQDDNSSAFENPILSLNYGTSFGFCHGYCINEIDIDSNSATYVKYSWNDDLAYPDINCETNEFNWNELVGSIDQEIMKKSEAVFGCPDCADGGSEWLEIEISEGTFRVIFEFRNEPDFLTEPIDQLRALKESFEGC